MLAKPSKARGSLRARFYDAGIDCAQCLQYANRATHNKTIHLPPEFLVTLHFPSHLATQIPGSLAQSPRNWWSSSRPPATKLQDDRRAWNHARMRTPLATPSPLTQRSSMIASFSFSCTQLSRSSNRRKIKSFVESCMPSPIEGISTRLAQAFAV
jgi:hypothetical protein